MANRTVKDARSIRGTNAQYLIEKIIRSRIYDSKYWKEECFALSAELVVDKAMELRYIGGIYGGNIKPTPFLCLTLKLLQIQPEKDIIVEFIKNEEFKYVRALGAMYMRLVGSSVDCYKYLEPLFNDGRKLRRQNRLGDFEMVHMDEFIDELLRDERACDVILPRIQKRHVLEENNQIESKISALDDDLDDGFESSCDGEEDISPVREKFRSFPESYRSDRKAYNRSRDKDWTPERDRLKDRKYTSRYRDRSQSRDRTFENKSRIARNRTDRGRKDSERRRSADRDRVKVRDGKHKKKDRDRSRDREKTYRSRDRI